MGIANFSVSFHTMSYLYSYYHPYSYYSRYYDYPYYSRYSPYLRDYYWDSYYYPRYSYRAPLPLSDSYVSYDSPTKTEVKTVSPGKVTTTTVDKSPVSPALDRTTTTTTYTDPYPYYSRYYPSYYWRDWRYGYDRYYDPY